MLNQILLSDNFLLPHSLMFDRGIIEFIILLIVSLILFLTKKLEISYTLGNIIYIILIKIAYTIIESIKAFCLMKTIYIYTSQYVSFLIVSESVGGTLNLIINMISKKDDKDEEDYYYLKFYKEYYLLIPEIISVIIITFGTLMYNEMIIINKCGLQEKTKRELLIKEKKDYSTANDKDFSNNEDSEDGDNNEENDDNDNDANEDKTINMNLVDKNDIEKN